MESTAHLRYLHLLHRAHHLCSLFTPVTFHHVTFYGRAINRHYRMSCTFMRVEPAEMKSVTSASIVRTRNHHISVERH